MYAFASLEFNTVFSSNAHVCEMKIPQSFPVGASSPLKWQEKNAQQKENMKMNTGRF